MAYVSASEPAMFLGLGRESLSLATGRARSGTEPDSLPATFDVIRDRSGLDASSRNGTISSAAPPRYSAVPDLQLELHWANHYLAQRAGEAARRLPS